jgi:gas vesicle protein
MTHHTKSGSAAGLAFIVGAGAGIAAGMLLAPRKGEETRQQIKDRVQKARSKAQEVATEQKDMVEQRVDQAKDAVQLMKETAKESKEDVQDAVKHRGRKATSPPKPDAPEVHPGGQP